MGASASQTGLSSASPMEPQGSPPKASIPSANVECHGLDTPERVCFYEQDFYVLSNFSSFSILWEGIRFDTSEHLYHWLKFATSPDGKSAKPAQAEDILAAPSAHAAFKIAQVYKADRRPDWDEVKVDFMRRILREKVSQHEYVHRKLLATGNRELVENSWRDDYWGWGPNRDGQNMLGKLWMEVRAELRAASAMSAGTAETGTGSGLQPASATVEDRDAQPLSGEQS